MSYAKQIVEIAEQIREEGRKLESLESGRKRWMKPEAETFCIGSTSYWVVLKDGTVTPGLESIQREAIKLHDAQISATNSRIEGLRFKLVQLSKNGGAA